MKKIILLVIMMIIGFTAFADTELELAYYPDFNVYNYIESEDVEFHTSLFAANIFMDRDFGNLTLGGYANTFMIKMKKGWTFYPVSVDYGIFAEYEVIEDVTIGAEHQCDHPINPYAGYVNNNIDNTSSNKFYAKIKF